MLNLRKSPQSSSLVRIDDDPYRNEIIPAPCDVGLPEKFTKWRPWQYATVERIIDDPHRFFVLCSPCGSGKSLSAMSCGVISGLRTVLLTATKGLQDQIGADFTTIATDIRGMSNYRCPIATKLSMPASTTVSEAPCTCGYKCALRFNGGCEYYDRYRRAQSASAIVTNYQCWFYDTLKEKSSLHIDPKLYEMKRELSGNNNDDPRKPVELLVCDEADKIEFGELARFVGVDVSRRECLHLRIPWLDEGQTLEKWRHWAEDCEKVIDARVKDAESKLASARKGSGQEWSHDLRRLRDMKRKLSRLTTLKVEDDWILDEHTERDSLSGATHLKAVRFTPLYPARYAEQALWRGVKKIVLMSATVRPETARFLGIDPGEMTFLEFPSSFDPKRRPVIQVPSVQMNYRTEKDDRQMLWWLKKLDTIIGARQDRKGIIHAVSYARAQFIRDNSEFGRFMLIHNSRDREEVIEKFRRSPAPAILVSPSVDTGYDFAGDQCRYAIIAKLPFASVKDKLVKARQERDKEYGLFLAAQTLVQMSGRPVRSESDWAEIIILDDSFSWFYPKVKKFLPRWWMDAVRKVDAPPPPLSPENLP